MRHDVGLINTMAEMDDQKGQGDCHGEIFWESDEKLPSHYIWASSIEEVDIGRD